MNRRGLFQALAGLVVAGTARAGSHEPQQRSRDMLKTNPYVYASPHPCPVCKEPAVATQNRLAEVAPRDTRCFEIMGVYYYHVGKSPCDLPIQKVVPIKEPQGA